MGCSSSKTVPSEGFNNLSLKHLQIKCVLLGDANVGKSSITGRYMRGHFSDVYDVTLGGVYNKKQVTLKSGEKAFLHIWDTGGQQRYRAMAPLYYRGAALGLLVCSVDNISSLKNLGYWMDELEERRTRDAMSIIIVANKCDVQPRQFTKQYGEQWAMVHAALYHEVSAKTGYGIPQVFELLLDSYVRR